MSQRPYPGLRAFGRDEIDIFFGRERQTDEILEKLQHSHFLAVLGPSGCGKSSLMRTGVLSALDSGFMCQAGAHWLVADMKPGSEPFLALAQALLADQVFAEHYQQWFPAGHSDTWKHDAQYFLQASLQRGSQSLHELLDDLALPAGYAILLLVDQFEEMFRYQRYASNEAGGFVDLIVSACHHPAVYTAITMRSEFLGNCVAFQGLPEAINQGLYLTPSLDRDQLSAAIAFPVKVFSGEVTPALVNRLLNDSGLAVDQLPLLQHALMRQWENDHDKVLTLAEYEATGGLQRMLNDHLEEVWQSLDAPQQVLAGQLFRLLTEKTPEGHGVRRPVTFADALNLPHADREQLTQLIDVFRATGRHFLMPPPAVELQDNTVLDITHESLIRQWQRLKHWVDTEAERSLLYQRLEDTALRHQQGEAALLSSPDLEIALHWRDVEKPNLHWAQRYGQHFDTVMQFLEQSVQAKHAAAVQKRARARSRNRRTILSMLLGFVVALGAAIAGWMAAANSKEKYVETKAALTLEQVTQQKLERENEDLRYKSQVAAAQEVYLNAEHGVQALYGKTLYESLIAQARLYMEDQRYPEARKVLLDATTWQDKAAPSLQYQLKLMQRKLEISGVSPSLAYQQAEVPLHAVAIDYTKNALISAGERGQVYIYQRGESEPVYRLRTESAAHIQDVAIHPKGDGFVTVDDAGALIVWEWQVMDQPPKPYLLQSASGAAKAVAYSADGQYIAVGYTGNIGRVRLWKAESGYLSLLWTGLSHTHQISEGGLAFTPNGLLASASHDGSVRFWEVEAESAKPVYLPLLHGEPVLGMSFSKDGKYLATASGKQVFIWDWQTALKLHSFFTNHKGLIFSVRWVEDQFGVERLVTASLDHSMRMWKIAVAARYQVLLAVLEGHTAEVGVSGLAYDSDRRQLYSPGKDGKVLQWRTNLPWVQLLDHFQQQPLSATLSKDGDLLAVGLDDGRVQIYHTSDYALLIDKQVGEGAVLALAFDPKKHRLAVVNEANLQQWGVSLWSYSTAGSMVQLAQFAEHQGRITALKFSDSGARLYSASMDGRIGVLQLQDLSAGMRYSKVLHSAKTREVGLRSLSLSTDQKQLLTASKRWVMSWALDDDGLPTGLAESQLNTRHDLQGAYFAPNQDSVIMIGRGANINRYTLENNSIIKNKVIELTGHTQTVVDAHFIAEANVLMTLGLDAELHAWDLSSNQSLFTLRLPSHRGIPIPFSAFVQQCNKNGCRFAIPLKGKPKESGRVVIYDFTFRESL